jgi:hypothetical protein
VASAIGKSGLSMALNISQVYLFIIFVDDRFLSAFCYHLFRLR